MCANYLKKFYSYINQQTTASNTWEASKQKTYAHVQFHVHVVVNFLSQVIFVFLLFLGMVMYANEVETGKIKITRDKKLTTTYIYTRFPLLLVQPSNKR